MKHQYAIADPTRRAHVVRDNDGCDFQFIPHAHHQFINTVGNNRVKAGRRLVVKNDLRLVNDGARDADAFSHAAGKFCRLFILRARQIHNFQRASNPIGDVGLIAIAFSTQWKRDVFRNRHGIEESRALKNHSEFVAHTKQLPLIHWHDAFAINQYFAAVRLDEADDELKQNAFAAAAATDDCD